MAEISYINLADLNLPVFQAHRDIHKSLIVELTESIKDIGIIEPLIVRDTDNGTEIVAGCLRFQCAKLAGLKAVPCINMSLDPKAAEVIKLHENIKRIPLDHVDQGSTFIMMMETFHMTEDSIATHVGKSIAYISQHVSLVRLYEDITKSVKEKKISFSQARQLIRIDNFEERKRLKHYCENDGATISVLTRWVNDYLCQKASELPPVESEPVIEEPENTPFVSRDCDACGASTKINDVRTSYYCPPCHSALKTAISEENSQLPPKSDIPTS